MICAAEAFAARIKPHHRAWAESVLEKWSGEILGAPVWVVKEGAIAKSVVVSEAFAAIIHAIINAESGRPWGNDRTISVLYTLRLGTVDYKIVSDAVSDGSLNIPEPPHVGTIAEAIKHLHWLDGHNGFAFFETEEEAAKNAEKRGRAA
jgi:hypothetical protein